MVLRMQGRARADADASKALRACCASCRRAEHIGAAGSYEESSYFFDKNPRTWRSQRIEGVEPGPELARRCRQEKEWEWDARWDVAAVCGAW